MSSSCCGEAIIRAGYHTISQRLLMYGQEAYSENTTKQRTVMWVFSFFDQENMCKKCKTAFGEMYDWFDKYGLLTSLSTGVRIVLEPQPEQNLIYTDLGMNKLPANIFCDEHGKIIEILFEFPDKKWLENYIMPYIQEAGKRA